MVITTADLLPSERRTQITRVFGCPVESYGSHELVSYLAGTVPGTQRYIFNPLLAYVEVTDNNGRVQYSPERPEKSL